MILVCSTKGLSQNKYGNSLKLNMRYGSLVAHRSSIDESLRGLNPRGVELSYSFLNLSGKNWHKNWGNPNFGFSLSYFDLEKDDFLGKVGYATIYFEKELFSNSLGHNLTYRIAPGISYSDRTYDDTDNPLNTLISSSINIVIEGSLLYNYKLHNNWFLNAGISITHYSNGAFKLPNLGVNIPSLNLGLSYLFNEKEIIETDESSLFQSSNSWVHSLAYSLKSAAKEYDDLDMAWTYSIQRIWHLRPRYSLLISSDLMFNNSVRKILHNPSANRYRIGIAAGQQFELGKFAVLTQVGYYVYRPEKNLDKAIYFRWGFKYKISKKLIVFHMLKTHYGRADLIEWGMAYQLQCVKE